MQCTVPKAYSTLCYREFGQDTVPEHFALLEVGYVYRSIENLSFVCVLASETDLGQLRLFANCFMIVSVNKKNTAFCQEST